MKTMNDHSVSILNYINLALGKCFYALPWLILFSVFSNNIHAEHALGESDAPVTIIEYASLTCGYCVRFHRKVLPEIRSRHISKGKVRFIYRHYPTTHAALRGAVAINCAGPEHYHNMLNTLFSTVEVWSRSKDIDLALKETAASIGINNQAFNQCLHDPKQEEAVISSKENAAFDYDVAGTPSFLINEKLVRGIKSLDEMEILIQEALAQEE